MNAIRRSIPVSLLAITLLLAFHVRIMYAVQAPGADIPSGWWGVGAEGFDPAATNVEIVNEWSLQDQSLTQGVIVSTDNGGQVSLLVMQHYNVHEQNAAVAIALEFQTAGPLGGGQGELSGAWDPVTNEFLLQATAVGPGGRTITGQGEGVWDDESGQVEGELYLYGPMELGLEALITGVLLPGSGETDLMIELAGSQGVGLVVDIDSEPADGSDAQAWSIVITGDEGRYAAMNIAIANEADGAVVVSVLAEGPDGRQVSRDIVIPAEVLVAMQQN